MTCENLKEVLPATMSSKTKAMGLEHAAKKQKVHSAADDMTNLDVWLRSGIATQDPEDKLTLEERLQYSQVLNDWIVDLRSVSRRRWLKEYLHRQTLLDVEYKSHTELYEKHCNWQLLFLMTVLECDMPIAESFYYNYPEAPLDETQIL